MEDLPDNFDLEHLRHFLKVIKDEFGRPLGTAIDGGANRGIWTKELLKHFDEVVAFESRPEMYERLKEACPQAKCYHYALWNKTGERVSNEYHGRNTGASHVFMDQDGGTKTMALDDTPYQVDFLKLDIEGAEIYALKGARKKIESYRPAIMVEMNGNGKRFYGVSDEYLSAFLDGLNYVCYARCNKDYLFLPR